MIAFALTAVSLTATPPQDFIVYEGRGGPGAGKHIVLISGDEEYRSEEALPQLGKILSERHGFKCTVLFSLNDDGTINPDRHDNTPGLEALNSADLCIMLLRFREWPDHQMKHFDAYYQAGKPFIGLRTSTHAFDLKSGPYERYGWRSSTWKGGFGRHVLGETWLTHWGHHGVQATRGVIEPSAAGHPLLRGVSDVFGTTDVYEAHPPTGSQILMRGQVLSGMKPGDGPAEGSKETVKGTEQDLNKPMMPIAWLLDHQNSSGRTNKVLTTTMGAATDLLNEDLRRFVVNGAFWMTGIGIPDSADVSLVGEYNPSAFGFGGFKKGLKPAGFR
jgi:hypothetical protein